MNPLDDLKRQIMRDTGIHLVWHCNVTVAVQDALREHLPDALCRMAGERAARRFVDLLFAGETERPKRLTEMDLSG